MDRQHLEQAQEGYWEASLLFPHHRAEDLETVSSPARMTGSLRHNDKHPRRFRCHFESCKEHAGFARNTDLICHINYNHNSRPQHKCPYPDCERHINAFKRPDKLNMHLQSVHNIKSEGGSSGLSTALSESASNSRSELDSPPPQSSNKPRQKNQLTRDQILSELVISKAEGENARRDQGPREARERKMDTMVSLESFRAELKWVRDSQELGRGAFGVVWRETCVANNLNMARAVKVLSKMDPRLSSEVREREINNVAALKEYPQYFVQFLESFEDEHSISIAMEYIQHSDLGKHLKDPWSEPDTHLITTQMLEGLIIMHNLGITHRDLRPENVFVASLSPILIKLGDFGISKRVQNNDTVLRTSCGAVEYTAPEIYIHARPEYTNAVDIWSLGCVVHKILTGRTPFTNPDLWSYAHGPTEFPVQHLVAKRISESGVEFVKCLMKKDPATRLSAEQARKAAWLNAVEETQDMVLAVESACSGD